MLQLFDDPAVQRIGKPAKARSALWSAAIHGAVFLFLLSWSLSPVWELPSPTQFVFLAAPPPPPPPPPPALARAVTAQIRRPVRIFEAKLTAPVAIPQAVPAPEILADLPPEVGMAGGVVGGVPGGVMSGTYGNVAGLMGGTGTFAAPPPPPPAPKQQAAPPSPPPAPKMVQVSAAIQEAKLLEMIRPEYPPQAKLARLQGSVRMRAMIDCEGRITSLEVVEGHPMLAGAARVAVERWRYKPTFIGDEPVAVATEIIVNFRLL